MPAAIRAWRWLRFHARALAGLAGGIIGPALIIAVGGRFDLTWLILLGYILLSIGLLAVLIVGMIAFVEALVLRLMKEQKD
ncbi:MAG: hypothetical protein HY660_03165 [Armatimonadetes bacterium]|nr:hypothetical protein [Armatimonadota bacterium]